MGQATEKTCQECGSPGIVFVSLVKAGKVTTACFCAKHAEEEGIFHPQGYALLDKSETVLRRAGDVSLRCPVCDCSQRDFERQGRFGCGACYGTFAGVLPPLFQRMHRGAEHRGKIPRRGADRSAIRHRLALLETQLDDAVRSQRFEWAAQTRDAIALLKAKLLNSPEKASPGTESSGAAGEGPVSTNSSREES